MVACGLGKRQRERGAFLAPLILNGLLLFASAVQRLLYTFDGPFEMLMALIFACKQDTFETGQISCPLVPSF